MYKLFAILLMSFVFTVVLAVPFISMLYRLSMRQKPVKSVDMYGKKTLFNKLHGWKVGTPTGGGLLIIIAVILFSGLYYALTSFGINWTSITLFITIVSFGLLGLYDDVRKMLKLPGRPRVRALRSWEKFSIQAVLGLFIGYLLFSHVGLHTVWFPILTPVLHIAPIDLGLWYVPFAAFIIISMSNAFNITDGMDGLSTGLLIIALSAFWVLAQPFFLISGDVLVFIAVLIGALLAFLYFNIFPARLFMGDTGSLPLGALLGVIALMINQVVVLPIIGGVFVAEVTSSLIQLVALRFFKKRVFAIAPLHHHFESIGWDETKVTMRFWLVGSLLAFVGLLIATVS